MFYMTSTPETGSQVARPGDSGRMHSCRCVANPLADRNCDDCGAISMYMHNQPVHLANCHNPTILEDQRDSSASVVCVRMNVGNQASQCGCQLSYKPRHGGGDTSVPSLAGSEYSPTRGRHHVQDNISGSISPYRPRSTARTSSSSNCALCQSDLGISKAKSGTGSTSASTNDVSNDGKVSPRPSILRDNRKKSRTRTRSSKSRSPSGSSKTQSSSSLNEEGKRKYNKHKRHKKAKFEKPSSSSWKNRIKPTKTSKSRDSGRSKSVRRQERSRRGSPQSPSRRVSASSGLSSESSRSSNSWELQFQEPKVKHSSRKHKSRLAGVRNSERETTETDFSTDTSEIKRATEYLQDNLHEPELCSVGFDCAKEICRNCQKRRHHSDCVCDVCMGFRKCLPDCLVCSRCYIIPCSSSEHLRKVVTSGCCAKCSCIKCKTKSRKRDKHSRKRRHKHKHRHADRESTGEWTQNHAATSSGSSHSGEQGSDSGNKDSTAPGRCSQFFQCDLLLGQCSTPTSGAASVPL